MVDADNRDVPANFGDVRVLGQSGQRLDHADSTVLAATNGAPCRWVIIFGHDFDA